MRCWLKFGGSSSNAVKTPLKTPGLKVVGDMRAVICSGLFVRSSLSPPLFCFLVLGCFVLFTFGRGG